MKCPNCNNESNSKFCPNCGYNLEGLSNVNTTTPVVETTVVNPVVETNNVNIVEEKDKLSFLHNKIVHLIFLVGFIATIFKANLVKISVFLPYILIFNGVAWFILKGRQYLRRRRENMLVAKEEDKVKYTKKTHWLTLLLPPIGALIGGDSMAVGFMFLAIILNIIIPKFYGSERTGLKIRSIISDILFIIAIILLLCSVFVFVLAPVFSILFTGLTFGLVSFDEFFNSGLDLASGFAFGGLLFLAGYGISFYKYIKELAADEIIDPSTGKTSFKLLVRRMRKEREFSLFKITIVFTTHFAVFMLVSNIL